MRKSSTTTGALAMKTVDWTRVPDEELVEEVEKRQKEEEERHQKEAEAEQKREAKKAKRATAAEARKWHHADSEAQASGSQMNAVKKRLACGSTATSPRGGQKKKQVRKTADKDDDDEIVILSSWKTKQQGGGESLKDITDRQWGELIWVVSTRMDVANGHLERIASMAQSSGWKMQCHYMLMEGLVGQQQMLLSRLVEVMGATGSGGAREVVEDPEEPKGLQEMQGEGSGGQEETEGVPGGVPEGELEDVLGNEPEDGTGAEDGAGEEAQKDKGKGKEKAL
ncbi:hypothetical protein ID866_11700 [Astraeus odoratus]|nr:hypothetical protein ID866_11700 [Astraeus odoratus]